MVEWLAGNRIRGTSTERTSTTGFNPVAGVAGGWKEVGRTTLGSGNINIDVSSLSDKRYYMVLEDVKGTSIAPTIRLNTDTGSNYAKRYSNNGGSDSTGTSNSNIDLNLGGSASNPYFNIHYISNLSTKEKLLITNQVEQRTAGAGNAPSRAEVVSKWANTSSSINAWKQYNGVGGNYNTGSEVVVLGWDPADTHTTNFWEELASVDWSSGGSISSGTFTAKKYLMVQGWYKNAADTGYLQLRVGNSTVDSGTNYANRYTLNGAADTTEASNNIILPNVTNTGASGSNGFFNSFIINNASNEKLVINHHVLRGGSGAGNAPARVENVSKWSNTSNQINIIEMLRSANNFTAGQIKVWGSN